MILLLASPPKISFVQLPSFLEDWYGENSNLMNELGVEYSCIMRGMGVIVPLLGHHSCT